MKLNKPVWWIIAVLCAVTFTYLIQTWPNPLPISVNNVMIQHHKKFSKVKTGDTISVMYVGTLEDGTIFDTNIVEKAKEAGLYNEARPYDPLTFTVGLQPPQVIEGFDKGVLDMEVGETKIIEAPVDKAYGAKKESLIKTFTAEELDAEGAGRKEWGTGGKYTFQSIQGPVQGTLVEKYDDRVVIDFNHPLANKDLRFEVTLVEIAK